ncbi:hypothetical protein WJX84_000374, partial [Apatococcus fuscideae]
MDEDRPSKKVKPDRSTQAEEVERPAKKAKKDPKIPVLPWMRTPISSGSGHHVPLRDVCGLHPSISQSLQAGGIQELFPAQAAMWRALAGGHSLAHDLCIAAPTGSGKTLAYALPIVNALSRQCTDGLQALVVLPSRDLAAQVFQVFKPLCEAASIRAVLLAAQCSQALETTALLGQPHTSLAHQRLDLILPAANAQQKCSRLCPMAS